MISDLKEFEKFLKICRKKGVSEITYGEISVKFGELPRDFESQSVDNDEISSDALTPDELIYYAVQDTGQ